MAKVGIYPGTFDPIHKGHVEFAQAALLYCDLDQVVFLPERTPRNKHGVSDFKFRIDMVELALQQHPNMALLQLDDKQFTIDRTLPNIKSMLNNAELVMLMGSDVVQTFKHRWPGLGDLLATVELAIGLRDGQNKQEIKELLNSLDIPYNATIIDSPHALVSASKVRGGLAVATDPQVREYIEQHGLYR